MCVQGIYETKYLIEILVLRQNITFGYRTMKIKILIEFQLYKISILIYAI